MDVVVCGGSVIGLSSALLLAREGHRVTVLEIDEQEAPEPQRAWDGWDRRGVPQFRQPHNLFPRFQRILEQELPELPPRLVEAGLVWLNDPLVLPPGLDPEPHPGDERFRFLTGRRPTVEAAFAAAARDADGVTVRRGVRVLDYLYDDRYDGTRVVGVSTSAGDVRGDLVLDAMGRHSPTCDLLEPRGAAPQVTAQDRGFAYYTRYFRGAEPPVLKGRFVNEIGSFSLLTMYGDNSTWSVTLFITSDDRPLKAVRDPEVFHRVVSECPLQAHWLRGEPITDVLAMAGVVDRHRSFVVEGRPVVTGLLAVGDAWACTNPSAGRGLSVGLLHAQQLPQVLREHGEDPEALALGWDAATRQHAAPFFYEQMRLDAVRLAEMVAYRDGAEAPVDEGARRLRTAAMRDPEVFRALMDIAYCLALPSEVMARPGIAEKVAQLGSVEAPPLVGPDRARLLELVS